MTINLEVPAYRFAYRGLAWGAETDFGVIEVTGIDGFDVRRDDRPLPRGHGNVPGLHVVDEGNIIFTIEIDKRTVDDVETALQQFRRVFRVRERITAEDILYIILPGERLRCVYARPIGTPVERQASPGPHVIKLTAAFVANDPRLYSALPNEEDILPYYANLGGANFPENFSFNFGGPDAGQVVEVENKGSGEAWPIIEVGPFASGHIDELLLVNTTHGCRLNVRTPVLANQKLRISMHAVETANGETPITVDGDNRYGHWVLPRAPFFLGSGDNELQLALNGSASNVPAKIIWRDTWL